MAKKLATKKSVIGITATEMVPGRYEFTTGVYRWSYEIGMGLNLAVCREDDAGRKWTALIFAKTLDHAVMFASGYEAGRDIV